MSKPSEFSRLKEERTIFQFFLALREGFPWPFWLKSGSKPPGLSFRCICHLGNPIKTRFESGFCLLCTSHDPCCLSPYHQVWEIWLYRIVSALWWNMDTKLGGSQLRAEPVGRLSRGRTSHWQISSPSRVIRRKETSAGTSLLSRLDGQVLFPGVTHCVIKRYQKSEDAVMEDCTESHQDEINKKIGANDKLRKILTNMPGEHKSLIHGDSLKAKMQSLVDEKVALLAAKRQFLPVQSRIEKQKNYLERIFREIETKQQHRLEILQKWIEADQELDAAHAKQVQAKHEMSILVAEQTAENAKAVNQALQVSSHSHHLPTQTLMHNRPSSLSFQICSLDAKHGVPHTFAEQLMAAGATDEEVRKISQIMAQTVRKLEGGSNIPETRIEMPKTCV